MAIEHRADGADGRGLDIAMQPPDLLSDLRRAPVGSLALELNDQLLDLKGQLPAGRAIDCYRSRKGLKCYLCARNKVLSLGQGLGLALGGATY